MLTQDLALIEQWRDTRDAEAFRTLTTRHAPTVYAAARRILRNATEADDVTQECFEVLAFGRKRPDRNLGAWLHKLATNRALNHIRTDTRRRERETRFASEHNAVVNPQWNDIAPLVDEAIANLPTKYQTAVVSHYLEGIALSHIAQAEGLTRQAVRYRVDKGVELIRKSLKKRGITVGTAALTTELAANMSEAAVLPAALAASLGKIAVSGATVQAGAGAGTVAAGGILGGILTLKNALIAVTVAALAGVATLTVIKSDTHRSRQPQLVQVDPEAAAARAAVLEEMALQMPEPARMENDGVSVSSSASPEVEVDAALGDEDGLSFSGRVVNAAGEGIKASVNLRTNGYSRGWMTKDDGTFLVTGIREFDRFSMYAHTRHINPNTENYPGKLTSEIVGLESDGKDVTGLLFVLNSATGVSGRLVDASGKAVGNYGLTEDSSLMSVSKVRVVDPWFLYYWTQEVDENGLFDFSELPSGNFTIEPMEPFIAQDGVVPERIRLQPGQKLTGYVVKVPLNLTQMTGVVRGTHGQPIEGVTINITEPRWHDVAISDGQGLFKAMLPKGDYTLEFRHSDYLKAELKDVFIDEQQLDIRLAPRPVITGQLLRKTDGLPIEKGKLSIEILYNHKEHGRAGKRTMGWGQNDYPEGRFEIKPDTVGGNTALIVSAAGHKPTRVSLAPLESGQMQQVIVEMETSLPPLVGVVVDESGDPVEGAILAGGNIPFGLDLTRPGMLDSLSVKLHAITDAKGAYALHDLPDEEVELRVQHIDYLLKKVNIPPLRQRPTSLDITLDSGLVHHIKLLREGEPVSGWQVSMEALSYHEDSPVGRLSRWSATTDMEGRCTFSALREGKFSLHVVQQPSEEAKLRFNKKIEIARNNTETIVEIPSATASIHGRVTLAGQPNRQLSVSLNRVAGSTLMSGSVDFDGYFAFNNFPAGEVLLELRLTGTPNRVHLINLNVRDNARKEYNYDFPLADASLEILCRDTDKEVSSIVLEMETVNGLEKVYAIGEPNPQKDSIHIDNVPAGKGILKCGFQGDSGQFNSEFPVVLESGMLTQVDVSSKESADLVCKIENAAPGDEIWMMVLPADLELPDIPQMTINQMERLPHVFVGGGAYSDEGMIAQAPEPGMWMVLAIAPGAKENISSEDEILPNLKFDAVNVEVPVSGTTEVTLHLH